MRNLTGWWNRQSDPARIELYTRSTFHLVALAELGLLGGSLAATGAPGGVSAGPWLGLLVLVALHALLGALLSTRGLDWILGRRERPVGLLTAVAALTATGVVTALALRTHGSLLRGVDVSVMTVGLAAFGLGAIALAIRGTRPILYCVLGTAAGTGAVGAVAGLGGPATVGFTGAVLACGAAMVFTSGCSVWLISVVWELDAAREVQARLAVAEERLRFGRDLHDVMGRNLAVIALKSELAVQLARRGRAEAVEQMVEVQRIARESQHEVREVVRGYRRADLAVELAGALSVLRAAGIDGQVEGDEGSALPPEVQAALGWVVREATTNVLRHSEARRCTIRLTSRGTGDAASVALSVDNDGVPESAVDRATGSGLHGLRERLAGLGGTLATEYREGAFRLTASVPLARPDAAPLTPQQGAAV